MTVDVTQLDHRWAAAWPGELPLTHFVRTYDWDRWVRFHSLPESKRYADTDAEYTEIERRHYTLLRDLQAMTGSDGASVLVISASYGESVAPNRTPAPIPLIANDLPWTFWMSFQEEEPEEPDDEFWLHAMVAECSLESPALKRILRLTADDEIDCTIIADPVLRWLYAPYDGGGDVIAPTVRARDELRARHEDWLSSSPTGM